MDNHSRAILKKRITRLVRRGALRDKKIVLFGVSPFSKEIKNCLSEEGFALSAVVDNDSRKTGSECLGVKVQKPETILLPHSDSFVVLVSAGGFYREITLQLVQMGYVKNRHIFTLTFKTDESLFVMSCMIARTIRGAVMYRKLTKGLPGNRTVFIAPYTGVGDIYLVGLFFNEYLRQNGITDYVFVVVSGACKKVAEMFGIKNIAVLKPTLTDDIINSGNFLRADWPVIVLNDGWLGELTQWLRGYKGLNFERMFRYFVLEFDDSVPYELPPRRDYSAETDAIFQKSGLIKGKTVVLSPYSNTLLDLPDDLWQSIVRHCKGLGYTVCTNCAAVTEKPVAGTEKVFFPLGQAIAFMDAAGYFIGVRSGLCDIISTSSCKKVVLYGKGTYFYKSSPYEYFSLEKMGLCGDALELEYRSDVKDDCLRKIFSVFR
ncbi:hypothetical protein FACS1894216_04380 [Synergistales bacterium]|nr:hypothetical protein FACS1894216_04380 [Synergistales bacterium]